MEEKLKPEVERLNAILDEIPDDDYFFTLAKRSLVVLDENRTDIRAVLKEYLSYYKYFKTEEDLRNLTDLEMAKFKKAVKPFLEYYDVIPSTSVQIAPPIRNFSNSMRMNRAVSVRSRRNQRGGNRWVLGFMVAGAMIYSVSQGWGSAGIIFTGLVGAVGYYGAPYVASAVAPASAPASAPAPTVPTASKHASTPKPKTFVEAKFPTSKPTPKPAPAPASIRVRVFDVGGSGVKTALYINGAEREAPRALGICPQSGLTWDHGKEDYFARWLSDQIPKYAEEIATPGFIIYINTAGNMIYQHGREYVMTDDWKGGGIENSKADWGKRGAVGISLRQLFGIKDNKNVTLYAAKDSYGPALGLPVIANLDPIRVACCVTLGTGLSGSVFRKASGPYGHIDFYPNPIAGDYKITYVPRNLDAHDPLYGEGSAPKSIDNWKFLGFHRDYSQDALYGGANSLGVIYRGTSLAEYREILKGRFDEFYNFLQAYCRRCGLISGHTEAHIYVVGGGAAHLVPSASGRYTVIPPAANVIYKGYRYMLANSAYAHGNEFGTNTACPAHGGARQTRKQHRSVNKSYTLRLKKRTVH